MSNSFEGVSPAIMTVPSKDSIASRRSGRDAECLDRPTPATVDQTQSRSQRVAFDDDQTLDKTSEVRLSDGRMMRFHFTGKRE
jgi:hypothetical protein